MKNHSKNSTDYRADKFLHATVSELKSKTPLCEVVAFAPIGKGKKVSLTKELKEYQPILQTLLDCEEISQTSGASALVRFGAHEGAHLLFVCLGNDKAGVDAIGPIERLRRIGAQLVNRLSTDKIKSAVLHFDTFLSPAAKTSIDATLASYALIEGMGLAAYEIKNYRTKDKSEVKPFEIDVATSSGKKRLKQMQIGLEQAKAMTLGAYVCRDLSNEPSNLLFPEDLAQEVKKLASGRGLTCTVLDEKALEKENMGLLLGVGQGSSQPPRLIALEYSPKGAKGKTPAIALVGKGVTFDSGGISIKPSAKMEDMKHDMSGAAAVIGAMVALAELKVKTRIIAVMACAENMPSGTAINPGNILTSRSGQTVEITNTDAEGRLVLADALDWVQDRAPTHIVDIATLTGAATITLGKAASVLFSNNEAFAKRVKDSSKKSGERVWEMPLFEEYFDELKSDYADMKNSGDSPSHGSAKGAYFLLKYIRKGVKWAHLDIASLAYNVTNLPYNKRGSTGYGVRLLVEIAKSV